VFEGFVDGLSYLGNSGYWFGFFTAILITVPIALIPGVSATLVMALAIPFIVLNVSDPVIGLAMLATLTGIDNTLDSIPAVLLGQPGAATQVTFLEGNQLAQQGKAAHTLGAIYVVSAIGGIVGALMLAILIPVIKPFVLEFGFAEIAAMAMFGVAMVAALSGGAMVKGIVAGLLGIMMATVGPDPVYAIDRYWYGHAFLWDGFPLIATVVGLFALPEMIDLTVTKKAVAAEGSVVSYGEVFRGARYGLSRWKMAIRQSLFGVFLGAVPGIGSGVVDWLAYAFGIFWTKDKSQFGKGSLEGVLFAEAAQNSKEAGQAVPTLAFGVPGGRAWAFILVGMLFYGISPGPQMLDNHADITIMMVVSLGLGNLMVTMLGLGFTGQMAKLTFLPYPIIGFFVIPISLLASFQQTGDISAIWIVFGGAIVGLLMKRYKWPRPPLLIGFILGGIIESNLISAVSLFRGDWGQFATRPLFIALVVLAVVTAIVFAKFMSNTTIEDIIPVESGGGRTGISGASGTGPAAVRTRRTWVWNEGAIFALIIALTLTWAFYETFSFTRFNAAIIPRFASGVGMVLSYIQFVREGTGVKTGAIMDIGIRSSGVEGARQTSLVVAGLFLVLIILMGTIGLEWASVVIAFLGPAVIIRGKMGYVGGASVASSVLLLNLLFFDYLMAVIWPQKFILDFF
jgi:TctA family transporter